MNTQDAVATLESLPQIDRIAVARLNPTDVIVIESSLPISNDTAARIKDFANNVWPDHKCVVLGEGLTLKVVSR